MSGANNLGSFIKECRSNLGYTSRRVADITRSQPGLTGISHSNLLAIEKGRHVPTFDKILTLSLIYNVPTQHFEEQLRQDMLPLPSPEPGASYEALMDGGSAALKEGNHKLALELFTQALTVALHGATLGTPTERRRRINEARLQTANCRARVGLLRVAKDDFEELLSDDGLDPEIIARASWLLSEIHRQRQNQRLALLHAEAALQAALENGESALLGKVLTTLANTLDESGQGERAIEHYERALTEFERLSDRRAVGVVTRNLGTAYFRMKRYDDAIRHLEHGLEIAEETVDRRGFAYGLANLARAHYLNNDQSTAARYAKRAKELAEQEHYPDALFSAIFYLWRTAEYEHKGHLAQVYAERLAVLYRDLETRSEEAEEWAEYAASNRRVV